MTQRKFVIKDGVLLRIREERIVDRSKLLKSKDVRR